MSVTKEHVLKEIKRGDYTAPEVVEWLYENKLRVIPEDVLYAMIDIEIKDGDILVLLSDEGVGLYLDVELLRKIIGDGIVKKDSTLYDIFMNDENNWDYDIVKFLLDELKIKPEPDEFDLEELWQPEIIELFKSHGVGD